MKTILLPFAAAFFLSFGGLSLSAAESPTLKENAPAVDPKGARQEGHTGESAECPIKKTIDGKTYCFQNDPALTKPQGGG